MSYLIRQMGHVVLSAPDPEAAAQHLCDISGVRVTGRDGDTVYLSSNARHHEVTYVKGAGETVAIGLEAINDAAVDEVMARAKSDGLTILDDTPMGPGYDRAVRLRSPGGATYEIHSPITRDRSKWYIGGGGPRPRRLEHVNYLTPNLEAEVNMVEQVFGMKATDRLSDYGGFWLRAEDGFHHTIALVGEPELRMHHYAFDHHSLYDLQRIADNLAQRDSALIFGPGRHGNGENVFTYYLDPIGCVVENSTEMLHVGNDALHKTGVWDNSQGLAARWANLWGTPVPEVFVTAGIPFATTE
ncbi:MAG: VOC family protein [Pseudomonadota bacterium]